MAAAPGASGERDRLLRELETTSRTIGALELQIAQKEARIATILEEARKGRGLVFDGGSGGDELMKLRTEVAALTAQLRTAEDRKFRLRDQIRNGGPRPPLFSGGKRKTRSRKARRSTGRSTRA